MERKTWTDFQVYPITHLTPTSIYSSDPIFFNLGLSELMKPDCIKPKFVRRRSDRKIVTERPETESTIALSLR